MKEYVIITESGSDLSPGVIKRYDIRVLPMHVALGNKDCPDGSISTEELCGYYDKTGEIPRTSAVNPYEYQQAFEKIETENLEAIILHISYSSQASCTFQNARIASSGLSHVHHIDSLNVSGGLALVVMKAAELIEQYPHIMPTELTARMQTHTALTRFFFVPGNLDYLRAGGRVPNSQHLGASLLNMKPLIEIVDGKLVPTKTYIGSMKSITQFMIKGLFLQI